MFFKAFLNFILYKLGTKLYTELHTEIIAYKCAFIVTTNASEKNGGGEGVPLFKDTKGQKKHSDLVQKNYR